MNLFSFIYIGINVLVLFCVMMFSTLTLSAQNKEDAELSFESVFDKPPKSTRPHVYWYWVSNNISKEGIRKDLEAMARIGIGGVIIAQIGYKDSPVGKVSMFSNEWWDCLTFAMEEAARLGIEVSLFNSPGWSGTGGPWIKPQQAMRYLDVREYRVKGPKRLVMQLPDYASKERIPQSSLSFQYDIDKSKFQFQQVGVQAFPAPKGSEELISASNSVLAAVPATDGIDAMFDGDESTKTSIYDLPLTIELNLKDLFTIRSIEIVPADIPFDGGCMLEYQSDSGDWNKIVSFRINRGETRIIASGFLPFAPVSQTFPAVRSKNFRITFSGNETDSGQSSGNDSLKRVEKGRIAEVRLSGAVRLNNYTEKQLGNKAAYKNNNTSFIQNMETGFAIKQNEVLDLISHVDKSGLLTWDVPAGDWILQHSGMSQTGVQIHPVPSVEVMGFAADALNKEAIQASFDAYIGQILERIPPEKRKTLTNIVLDSYEQGSANWSDGFANKFKDAYGYDPMPWIPVLKGHVVESTEQSNRFLWDLRRLVADLLPENFSGAIRAKSHENGLKFWHEPYGGHGFPGEFMNLGKYTDIPAGEFWVTSQPGKDFALCRAASSIANVYGRKIVSVEAFTSMSNYLYKMIPRDLKILGDWAFAQGMNHFTLHVSVHQPSDDKPGINTWYGTEFNRNNNWFRDTKTYIDYIRRTSAMVQRGQRQTDIAIYIGDEVPCDKPKIPYPLPEGYDFDFINYDALINLAQVDNGRLVLPSKASYSLLILPQSSTMRPELLQKLEALVKSGLVVYGPRPLKSPGLKGYPECDTDVKNLSGRLWGNIDGKNVLSNSYGKGKLFFGMSLAELMPMINLPPDIEMPADFVYTHRLDSMTDIYFVANQKNEPRKAEISFRVANKQPELLNALTGERRTLNDFIVKEGRTIIPMEFAEAGSCFVIFRDGIEKQDVTQKNYPVYSKKQAITGKWDVTFSSSVNPPFQKTLEQLADWTTFDEKEVKYFCGTATYTINFDFEEELPGNWFINLGKVESLAKIRLNGKEINTLWCYPYRVEVSDFLIKGRNKLEIDIVNQWWNQLIGDEQPGVVRKTNVSARLFWKADDPLLPTGLLGPVVIEASN